MIKTINACTYEIDDAELAVSEIVSQIAPDENLCKNSIGIITCYSEFIESGVVEGIANALPFDIAGCTTMGNSVNGSSGHMLLTLTVITSDDVKFSASLSSSLAEKQNEPLKNAYASLLDGFAEKPSVIFSFAPLIFNVGGDIMLNALNDISGGVPVFGTMAVDHNPDYHDAKVIYNNIVSSDSMAMIALYGKVDTEFFIASISSSRVMKQKAVITASEGNVLKEVNGISITKYMEDIGLAKDGVIQGANSIPFVIDYNDGTEPVVRAIFAQTPEGYAVCGGEMPLNSTLSVGALDSNDVIDTTGNILKSILGNNDSGTLFIFSCIGRNIALGFDTMAEMNEVENLIGNKLPYVLSYSGGEICPVYDENHKPVNRFHNNTFIICMLK